MKLSKYLLFIVMILSGFNYLPILKINGIPYFQIAIIFYILISLFFLKKTYTLKLKAITLYKFYIISSIPAFIIGMLLNDSIISDGLLVLLYTAFPYLIFRLSFNYINKRLFKKLLVTLNISMILIVIVGWLLRLSILPLNFFFDIMDSEFLLGYWGISYMPSTRNHDYLYPLIGLCISLYFYSSAFLPKFSVFLILFFSVTLIASNSRGAFVITVFSLFLLLKNSPLTYSFAFLLIFISLILINYEFIETVFNDRYLSIISSIFEVKNSSSQFSNETRLIIISDALQATIINPFGYGFYNYSYIYDNNFVGHVSNSGENAYLTILVERGFVSFYLFIYLFIVLLKENFRNKKPSLNRFLVPALSIYFLFNYELNSIFPTFIFFVILIDYYLNKKSENKPLRYE